MRKLILSAFFVAASTVLYAQNLSDIKEKVEKKKFDEAKEKIDKAATDPKAQSNSEYWFIRAQVYNNLAKSKSDTALQAGALAAIQKYFELESKVKDDAKRGLLSMFDNHQTAIEIYSGYFQAGVKGFQSSDWATSAYNFEKALEAFDVLSKNKLTTAAFDTTATLYAGYAAQNGKMMDQAAKHYSALADRRISDTTFMGIYEFLINYYQNKKDDANSAKYLDVAKSVFPGRPIWIRYELQYLENDKGKKMARLKELTAENKDNYDIWLEYATELFNLTYGNDKPADYTQRQEELTGVLQTLISLNPSAVSNFIMSQHISNQIYDMQQAYAAIKGAKPEDVKKRQQLNKDIDAKFDQLFKYASKSAEEYGKMEELKPVDKANYRKMLNEVADYYRMKKQDAKAKEFADKAKAL